MAGLPVKKEQPVEEEGSPEEESESSSGSEGEESEESKEEIVTGKPVPS